MFEQTFVEGQGQTTKTWTTMGAFIAQIIFIIIAVLVPLIFTDVLPKTQLTSLLVAPPPPPPPPPPAPEVPQVKAVKVIPRQFDAGRLMAPKSVPTAIAVIQEEELPPPTTGVAGGINMGGGMGGGVLGSLLSAAPTQAVAPPPKIAQAVQRIRVGGNVQQANLVRKVNPSYPPLAKQARIQGHVMLQAVISKEGTIQDLKVASGHPLLVQAALDAVKQWVYRPTMLNGEPVEVSTEIDVNFTLSQ